MTGPRAELLLGFGLAAYRSPVARAADGDLEALRDLANGAYAEVTGDTTVDPISFSRAITFAQLAAVKGDTTDRESLVFLLAAFANFWRERGRDDLAVSGHGAALATAEQFGEDGDERLADMVATSGDELPAEVHLEARRVRYDECVSYG